MYKILSLFFIFTNSNAVTVFKEDVTPNFVGVTQFQYKSCGDVNDIGQNIVMDVTPKLPQTDYTLFLNADLSKEINKGTSKYSITYNFIPFTPSVEDLCTEISNSNISCPLNGHISLESKGSIPVLSSGTVVIKNEWFNELNARILCMQFTIKI